MPWLQSIFYDPIFIDPKWVQVLGGAGSNAAVVLTIPAQPSGAPHILAIAAGFSDGVTSQVLTIVQAGNPTKNYTITGEAGFAKLIDPQYLVNAAITITLPASGVGGVIGHVNVLWRIA